LHWSDRFRHWPLTQHFDHSFLSFELGVVKPDRALFDVVARRLEVDADRILFIDDNRINVDGARESGWRAELAVGVAEAKRVLLAHGIFDG
jgi:putative hydrolase of the HAD superfamily